MKKYTILTVNTQRWLADVLGPCVSYTGTANLPKTDGKMNAACYRKMLEENLHSSAQKPRVGLERSNVTAIQNTRLPPPVVGYSRKKVKVLEGPSQS